VVSVWFEKDKPFSGDVRCRLLAYKTDFIVVLGGDPHLFTSEDGLYG
jgi:hypothetical protein